jgi:hypothetical protein
MFHKNCLYKNQSELINIFSVMKNDMSGHIINLTVII